MGRVYGQRVLPLIFLCRLEWLIQFRSLGVSDNSVRLSILQSQRIEVIELRL